ncbi:MAG TPA: hypothetical protein VKA49_23170, partial [Flavitalea sp.]|nr:hypothetical protein [Flavitalea sp.]
LKMNKIKMAAFLIVLCYQSGFYAVGAFVSRQHLLTKDMTRPEIWRSRVKLTSQDLCNFFHL